MELLVFSDAHYRNESGQGPAGEVCSLHETVKQRNQGRKGPAGEVCSLPKLLSYKRKETRQLTSQTSILQMLSGWGGSPVGVGHEKAGSQADETGKGNKRTDFFTSSFKMLVEY